VSEGPAGPIRWYGTATDIHDLRDAQEALVRTQASLGLAMRGARMGWWSRDLATDEVTWSAELEEIVGLEPGAFGGDEVAFRSLVLPEDRPLVAAAVDKALETGNDYVVEFRYRHADGSTRWMEGRGRAVYEGGRPTWLFGLGIDITARRNTDELRDLFLGMLSHELRTPVTAIFGGAQLLRRDSLDEPTRREITDDVVAESERLERLVENLLVLARVERNAELGGHDPVLVRPLVSRVVESELRARSGAAVPVEVLVTVEPGLPPAFGDEPSVELCIRNLVSNAVKYGPPEGPVEITVRLDEGMIEVSVRDRGPGLPPDDRDRVFELFYRTRNARMTAAGAGVGLYVVRALVESMGGAAWARNADGGGAEFGFRLPVFEEAAGG
jgi:PAS domain S-box-containing protein